ncbi:MAG: DUF4835 family protein [Fluviicola sp.]|nr:DUF4835 family protein [Fluviicola sp.]
MKFLVSLLFIFNLVFVSNSQELNCQVSVIIDARLELTSVEKEVLEQMENTIYELMNNTQWTKDKFTVEERINCTIQFQIDKVTSAGSFSGSMQVQSSRPALNSSYNTTMFNFQDKDVAFSYSRNAILIYVPNQYTDNLTSMLAFYAYFILGMDYDSFSNKGGTKYFSMAQQVVSDAQASGAPGWKSNERGRKNRFWLVDNILHELFSPLRECNYIYHRKGIDLLYDSKKSGKTGIFNALSKLIKITSTRPGSVNLLNFVQAKTNEIKNLFADSEAREKNDIVNLLKRIDPANSSRYQEILTQ